MSKFAVGDTVDKAADDHEVGMVIAVFPIQLTATFGTPSIWRGTAPSSFSTRKNWSVTPGRPNTTHKAASRSSLLAQNLLRRLRGNVRCGPRRPSCASLRGRRSSDTTAP